MYACCSAGVRAALALDPLSGDPEEEVGKEHRSPGCGAPAFDDAGADPSQWESHRQTNLNAQTNSGWS